LHPPSQLSVNVASSRPWTIQCSWHASINSIERSP